MARAVSSRSLIGLKNYINLFTSYPFFWPAVDHNIAWLVTLAVIATPIGMFFAVLLDREMRGTRIYQSALFVPVVLSLALVGFIWQLQYRPSRASSTACSGARGRRHQLARRPEHQPLGRARGGQLAPCRLRDGPLPGRPQERRPDAA